MNFLLLNVSLLFLGVIYAVAYDDKKALTESSRLTALADIDPWINVTRLLPAGATYSQLFGKCGMNSRRGEYKPSSVVSPSTNFTYWRYELGQYGKNASPATWDKVLNVDDIFGCADAAAKYRLFRFEGNKCSLSNMTFLRDTSTFSSVEGQSEGNKDVIFINFDIPASSNVGNGVFINGENGPFVNIVEFKTPLGEQLFRHAYEVCGKQYRSSIYVPTVALPFSTLQNYLRTKNITGEFLVGAGLNLEYPRVEWRRETPADILTVVASSYEDFENKRSVVISSDHDYKLVVKKKNYKVPGVICMPVSAPGRSQ